MRYQCKIILESDRGFKFFGQGPLQLLKKTQKLGSLNKATKEMNMSYSKAFSLIKTAEQELNIKLLVSQTGGKSGGGSILTEDAILLIAQYEQFVKQSEEAMDRIYKKIFHGLE